MTAVTRPALAVVVLATRGGDALRTTLDAVAWADRRLVLDPAERVSTGELPAGVARVVDPRGVAPVLAGGSLLLLVEGERPAAGAEAWVAAAGAEPHAVFAVPLAVRALDLHLRLAGAARRLGPWDAAIAPGRWLAPELVVAGATVRRLDVALVRDEGATLGDAVEALGADATALAALAARVGRPVRTAAVCWAPLVAAARALLGRTQSGPLGLGRWVLAVLSGYRVVVGYASLWERRRDRVVEPA